MMASRKLASPLRCASAASCDGKAQKSGVCTRSYVGQFAVHANDRRICVEC